ncbi:LPS assembly lipoprotein LptE [Cochlodiniinecator piscidefendens]|uniref:LPS assembly lipoprotein LptE n=1 Tax=Cochlodiniinecator piscidefendens TaxID=2715756 RepID=UPI00140C9C08|nr:LPS assembly lipoprotein LptE [Cochlodiniinecator piscidefendens]
MSLSNRRTFLLGLTGVALTTGCGFQPVYGPNGGAQGLPHIIAVADPSDRNSFNLVRQLEQRLGQPQAPLYALSYAIELDEDELGINAAQEITRYNVLGTVTFTLREIATDAVVKTGTVSNFTSYSATGTTVSTLTAERDAYARLMIILADQVVTQILASAGELSQ